MDSDLCGSAELWQPSHFLQACSNKILCCEEYKYFLYNLLTDLQTTSHGQLQTTGGPPTGLGTTARDHQDAFTISAARGGGGKCASVRMKRRRLQQGFLAEAHANVSCIQLASDELWDLAVVGLSRGRANGNEIEPTTSCRPGEVVNIS